MTAKQKKTLLAIAKDALKNMKYYNIARGQFCSISKPLPAATKGTQLQKHIPLLKKGKHCQVCADGALFLSAVTLYNDFKVGYDLVVPELYPGTGLVGVYPKTLLRFLERKIGKHATESIEVAFEKGNGYHGRGEHRDAVDFGGRYKLASTRLRAILKNIIRNKGEFKPEQK